MKEVAHAVVKNNLSLIIFPEGTRSKNGRLLPFKKVNTYPKCAFTISSSHSGMMLDRDSQPSMHA
ncbi:hypothetical protein NC652_028358 [Populus alba x Populus x berolinensis]|nr:hypothetical protein NC652_028358 [Populus alba x Populus x berolinensis]